MPGMTPATDWKETVPAGEPERLERLAEQLRDLQRARAAGGSASRALHAKGAGAHAEFVVLPDLPEHARVGLFAAPATYRAYVRFSNGSPDRQHDRKGDVRGLAIKLLGVPGKKLIPGLEDATTQDFLLIQSASTPFRNADDFVWFVRAAARPALLLPRAIGHFGPIGAIRLIRKLMKSVSRPVVSVATSRYFSALPIKLGPYAVHYGLEPQARAEPGQAVGTTSEYLTEELATRLAAGPISYDFRVQFYRDEATTPIEDGSHEWLETDAPFVTLARLTLPRQELNAPAGKRLAELVERLSFDPWHASEDFRPLGNMMRARNAAYRLSTKERGAAPEPDGSERFD
jgi:Catalase